MKTEKTGANSLRFFSLILFLQIEERVEVLGGKVTSYAKENLRSRFTTLKELTAPTSFKFYQLIKLSVITDRIDSKKRRAATAIQVVRNSLGDILVLWRRNFVATDEPSPHRSFVAWKRGWSELTTLVFGWTGVVGRCCVGRTVPPRRMTRRTE